MDVRALAARLQVREPRVLAKAQEYHRLLQAKQGTVSCSFHTQATPDFPQSITAAALSHPPSPCLLPSSLCQTSPAHSAVCLDLACRLSVHNAGMETQGLLASRSPHF